MLLPQLRSEATMQCRVTRGSTAFRASNTLVSGSILTGDSTRPMKRHWNLAYEGLTGDELRQLESFCASREATIDGFDFLDPFSNLLDASEFLTSSRWISAGSISISEVPTGIIGGDRVHLVTNSANDEQPVSQSLALTGHGTFCASCYVRSQAPDFGRLLLASTSETHATVFHTTPEWKQIYLSATVTIDSPPLIVTLELASGCSLFVKQMQLEHQAYPSRYKPTLDRGGLYAEARVAIDSQVIVQEGPDWFNCSFRVDA